MNKRQRKKQCQYRSAFTGTTRIRRRSAGADVQRIRGQVYLRWGPSGWWRVRRHNTFERYPLGSLEWAVRKLYQGMGLPVPEHVLAVLATPRARAARVTPSSAN